MLYDIFWSVPVQGYLIFLAITVWLYLLLLAMWRSTDRPDSYNKSNKNRVAAYDRETYKWVFWTPLWPIPVLFALTRHYRILKAPAQQYETEQRLLAMEQYSVEMEKLQRELDKNNNRLEQIKQSAGEYRG